MVVAAALAAACSQQGDPERVAPQSASTPATLTLSHPSTTKPVVGTEIIATAEGLPPRQIVDLIWQTVDGGWVVEDYYRFRGKKYSETSKLLLQAEVGENGGMHARFNVPEDFGGIHEVVVTDVNGVPLAQGGVEVTQSFDMHPADGPIGTPIELRVKGLGWRTMESTWVINWDNQEVGWVSAASTRGTAVARFRATGPAGEHQIHVLTGYMGQGYLNHEQAPNAYLPRPSFVFRVTPGSVARTSYAEVYAKQPTPAPDGQNGAMLSVAPTQGPVSTRAVLKASGLPANQSVSLVWGSQEGSRVSGNGFAPIEKELATLSVGADGRVEAPLTIPEDLGGLHSLSLRTGDTTLARAHFVIETSIVGMTPASGPAGTPVTIHLKGVGWTDYDNIYIATYDNGYMGYACGFNSQGDVVINFTASGAPGVHLIDLYPGIYQGPEGSQQLYRLPQLTYADDHPGNRIPALRFAFEVTPGRGGDPKRVAPPSSTAAPSASRTTHQ
jgi:hypothetical protein